MTDGDRRFLARLVASHKEVISEECRRKKLDKSEYYRRASLVWTRKLRKLSVRTCVLEDFSQHSVQPICTETMFNQKYNRYGVY